MSVLIPEWLPFWAQLVVLGLAGILVVAFLLMPFAVFGIKGRLAELELQMEDIQADLRVIALRLSGGEGTRARVSMPRDEAVEWQPPAPPEAKGSPEFRPLSSVQPAVQRDAGSSGSVPTGPSAGRSVPNNAFTLAAAQQAARIGETAPLRDARRGDETAAVETVSSVPVFSTPPADADVPPHRDGVSFFPTEPDPCPSSTGSPVEARPSIPPAPPTMPGADPAAIPRVSDAYEPRLGTPSVLSSMSREPGSIRRERLDGREGDDDTARRRMPWHEPVTQPEEPQRAEPILRWPSRRDI